MGEGSTMIPKMRTALHRAFDRCEEIAITHAADQ
jgi:hypothetical protein